MLDRPENDVCIVGCGRSLRRDDQAGLYVVESLLRRRRWPRTSLRISESPATDLPRWLNGVRLLILVDAAKPTSERAAGTFQRIDYRKEKDRLNARVARDTHSLSVDLALALAGSLGILPGEVWIYAVAAEDCSFGEGVSPRVARAIERVARLIQRDVQRWIMTSKVCHA